MNHLNSLQIITQIVYGVLRSHCGRQSRIFSGNDKNESSRYFASANEDDLLLGKCLTNDDDSFAVWTIFKQLNTFVTGCSYDVDIRRSNLRQSQYMCTFWTDDLSELVATQGTQSKPILQEVGFKNLRLRWRKLHISAMWHICGCELPGHSRLQEWE